MQDRQDNPDFKCRQCCVVFSSSIDLNSHVFNCHHTDNIKKYKCTLCGKFLSSAYALKHHIRRHNSPDEVMFKCPVLDCNKAFDRKVTLEDHINTHYDIRPHGCHLCERNFFSRYSLQRHIKTNHAGK